ncbi:carbohydrate diacid regulator [Halobacillus andaensis]|uniref:Carbohydrate diacid regulator n=1 Tax=Halobacillus andaensis TaxID=1176239 RepID=A0A917B1X9_HALAA|nr:sugar diacid recognition domain-containing protein [Halobacillus andaensis]MBP2004896.1 sugar diacid utilization regulator [Halobacillus andaensis]GGF18045.1 carbohydrate diacid regulator [Halobacillus andaensis]
MELTEKLGQEIIRRLSKYIDVPINLMNPHGKIVASTDPSRLHQLHGGAKAVIQSQQPNIITNGNADDFSNVKPGVNLPIFHHGELAGVVGLTGKPDDVMQAARMTQGSVEITLDQMRLQKEAFFQERQWNHWLQRLLHPTDVDTKELAREAVYTLQVEIHKPWQVVVYQTSQPYELAERLRSSLEPFDPLFILPYENHSVVAALPDQPLTIEGEEEVVIGIGEPGYSISGLRQSYHQASEAIDLAGIPGEVVSSASLKTERLINHIDPAVYEEISGTYRQLLRELDASYIETLQSFFDNNLKMNVTASDLHIHRNTLIYRLDQLSKKTGLDPRRFQDAIILKTILLKESL